MIARELYVIMHLERRLHAIFCLFSVAANSRIGCDSVESPIGAIIAQQSCYYLKGVQLLHNSRATDINEKVSGIPLYIQCTCFCRVAR